MIKVAQHSIATDILLAVLTLKQLKNENSHSVPAVSYTVRLHSCLDGTQKNELL